jgi:hypothetical protein
MRRIIDRQSTETIRDYVGRLCAAAATGLWRCTKKISVDGSPASQVVNQKITKPTHLCCDIVKQIRV